MAGKEIDEALKSGIRPGLLREFMFAVQSLNEVSGSLSQQRRRVRRRVDEPGTGTGLDLEQLPATDVLDLNNGDGGAAVENTARRDDMAIDCAAVGGMKVPSKLKELLETGLLEGLNVRYIRGSKREQSNVGLAGVIKGCGIICFCDECKGLEIVSPTVFELHAGSANKRPADYIHLENRSTLRDVLNACKNAALNGVEAAIRGAIALDGVEVAIRGAIAYSPEQPSALLCTRCREPLLDARSRSTMVCLSCSLLELAKKTPMPTADTGENSNRSVKPLSLKRARNTARKLKSSSAKSQGKITKKHLRLHKLVFKDPLLPEGAELSYVANKKKLLSGFKKGSGICCSCCNKVISPSQFEAHAGRASRRQPYQHIYTSNGVCLHDIAVVIVTTPENRVSTDENDDLCNVCQGPGNLLCCDGCPRVFHLDCVSLASVPENNWYCKLCEANIQMERSAERNPNAIAAGRVPGVDSVKQITNRRIRIVNVIETPQDGGCALCRGHDFCKAKFCSRTVIICDQCAKEFHIGCLRQRGIAHLKEVPKEDWFCSFDCCRINSTLAELLEKCDQKVVDDLVDIIRRKIGGKQPNGANLDVTWRVLHGTKAISYETVPFFGAAVAMIHEHFAPILYGELDQNIIPHLVHGRNIRDKDLGGMYCAELTVNSKIVSVAVFRIFCKEVAEIPLVATTKSCQGKGYFQCLYYCLENLMKNLGVRNLLVPAAKESRSMWMNKFGFKVMPLDELKELSSRYELMNFDGTVMMQKEFVDLNFNAAGEVKMDVYELCKRAIEGF